ncbi:hypothetical protein [Nocardia niigatensis]|uniref:hypothetical protein n=1 Tax=Nocardia niigatensis TaxID=209249 RepID=UPI0002F39B32|nr:hypothetical protein [Nocardia niigatensis]
MRHRLGQATDAFMHVTWPWFAALVGNWLLYATGWIGVMQLFAVVVIVLGVCGVIAIGIGIWLGAALISDSRKQRTYQRRAARGRHPSSGRWVVADRGIGKPSAGDEFPALGDLPNP